MTFAVDRAGIVGADGATHTGNFDVAFCRCIPDVIMMAPASGRGHVPAAQHGIRVPGPGAGALSARQRAPPSRNRRSNITIEIGKAEKLREGKGAALLVFGSLLNVARTIAEELDLSLVNMRFIKPLDEAT